MDHRDGCRGQQFSTPRSCRLDVPRPASQCIWVETEDLVHSCPTFDREFERVGKSGPFFGRVFAMRERWSHKKVLIAAPICADQLPVEDCHTFHQRLSYWSCRSAVFWEVVGPTEFLLDPDVYGPATGPRLGLGGAFAHSQILDRHSFRLFLCQHEISGD